MIKARQIPDVVVSAARDAWLQSDGTVHEDWMEAIAAALNAWPEAYRSNLLLQKRIILPVEDK